MDFKKYVGGLFSRDILTLMGVFIITVGILMVFIIPDISKRKEKTNLLNAHRALEKIKEGLEAFKKDVGRYPTSEEGLLSLFQNPGIKGWRGPYIKQRIMVDPWGKLYRFGKYENGNKTKYFVASSGNNRKWETTENYLKKHQTGGDDIIKWLE